MSLPENFPFEVHLRYIPEEVVDGKRLGRHVRHDSRSLVPGYKFEAPEEVTIASVLHNRDIPILDQGDLGSCTGNATVSALGTDPFWETLPSGHVTFDENEAVKLYSAATKLDSYAGTYPPTDTGSDGLSVAKAAKAAGFISGYQTATSLNAVLAALQTGPVITGINWYSSFDSPDSSGLVKISKNAYVRGGHEPCIVGCDVDKQQLRLANSWGTSWGDNGFFSISYADYTRLLSEDGDATVFVPLTAPAPTPTPDPTPTPTPTPTPDNADQTLLAAQKAWAKAKGF